jgi:hypothetical protein
MYVVGNGFTANTPVTTNVPVGAEEYVVPVNPRKYPRPHHVVKLLVREFPPFADVGTVGVRFKEKLATPVNVIFDVVAEYDATRLFAPNAVLNAVLSAVARPAAE